jgi:hypothetical protein
MFFKGIILHERCLLNQRSDKLRQKGQPSRIENRDSCSGPNERGRSPANCSPSPKTGIAASNEEHHLLRITKCSTCHDRHLPKWKICFGFGNPAIVAEQNPALGIE